MAAMQPEPAPERHERRDEAVDAERLDRVAGGVAEEVGEQADRGRPGDAAERVPEDERAPVHARGARQPGGPHAQAEHEAPEEHGLGAVALEERLADVQDLQALAVKAPGTLEQPAPALAADQIADVVADDRRGGGEADHELDLEFARGWRARRP